MKMHTINKRQFQLNFSCLLLGVAVLMAHPQQSLSQVKNKSKTTHMKPDQPLPLDPAVRAGKLANGFTYYIRHNEEPKNRVVFYLANKVGSILETDDQQGLAHFMEHMSFNWTKHFTK